ncbi:5-carboxymethyl-2-hydroxymuconate Delta-isomerase [Rhizobium giardinii]|uniref:5-carboxymethyl-2-hydroxymuconate Delta-isomerase n=1 Tax=Rhizobium giardinii TaxID=56731 RepID=UPI0039E1B0AD
MPHLTVEYSANLEGRADLDALCRTLLETVLETGLFEIGAVRVRALKAEHYAIADRLAENSFIDLNLRIGKGRSADERKLTGEVLFAAASATLAPLFDTPHFALSLEIREIDAELSWKKNAIHPRLRGK